MAMLFMQRRIRTFLILSVPLFIHCVFLSTFLRYYTGSAARLTFSGFRVYFLNFFPFKSRLSKQIRILFVSISFHGDPFLFMGLLLDLFPSGTMYPGYFLNAFLLRLLFLLIIQFSNVLLAANQGLEVLRPGPIDGLFKLIQNRLRPSVGSDEPWHRLLTRLRTELPFQLGLAQLVEESMSVVDELPVGFDVKVRRQGFVHLGLHKSFLAFRVISAQHLPLSGTKQNVLSFYIFARGVVCDQKFGTFEQIVDDFGPFDLAKVVIEQIASQKALNWRPRVVPTSQLLTSRTMQRTRVLCPYQWWFVARRRSHKIISGNFV